MATIPSFELDKPLANKNHWYSFAERENYVSQIDMVVLSIHVQSTELNIDKIRFTLWAKTSYTVGDTTLQQSIVSKPNWSCTVYSKKWWHVHTFW